MRRLSTFKEDSFIQALKNLFEDLQVPVNYIADEPASPAAILGDKYKPDNHAHKLIDDVYVLGMVDDAIFEGQNQLFKKEWTTSMLKKIDKDYDGLVIFGVTLKQRDGDLLPTRSQLAEITRAFNRTFHYTPVTVVFKYGNCIAFANSERMKYKQEWREGESVGKVTMLKDVSIEKTHSGHMRILLDMQIARSGKDAITSFSGLYKYWQKVFNVSTLNKSFYRELSNWYFYAMKQVSFPDDLEKDENIRNATSLIRLITRIIFIWFIKEKGLVPEAIFNKTELEKILKEFAKNKTSCSYYQAILQNLFFGTLNQKMDERAFTKQGAFPQNRSEYGVKNLFRYVDLFKVDEAEALSLFKDVPFLNGGLFDCLDKPDDEGKILYVDGFSRNPRKQAIVPDTLFFSEEHEADLNEIYGTKNKKYTTKGLVEILSGYKFTVEENTPIEEEVALDPELLGKVFENLLASYNPETQTTARKQTGSFYTPREIVNYMVDESLKAYLKGHLLEESSMTEEDLQASIDLLFEYTEKEHVFNEADTKTLIDTIDKCKILDPACGSGAFPMGVLHKMVHILHKLDPSNKQWEQRQIYKVDKLIEEAQGITDTAAREQVIAGLEQNRQDIEDAFGSNELDYGRKLYLIENCIYGVDIQPIAVQIAKLRFFISLVIDQKKQPGKENLGIRALPNLETKFVAANTLIGLEKLGQNLLKNQKIVQLEKDLKSIRHKYFSAKTRRDKINWQKKDRTLREEISKLLVDDGLDKTTAQLIVCFDPYDQNASAPFFDPEWMFGITDGFDVVIGNPPYVRADSGEEHLSIRQQITKSGQYDTLWEKWDLFIPFMERGFKLLKSCGITSLIVSDAYCHSKYAQKSQEWFLKNSRILRLDFLSKIKVFDAGVHNLTYFFQKANGEQWKPERRIHDPEFGAVNMLPSDEQSKLNYRVFFPEDMRNSRFDAPAMNLSNICYISVGMVVNANEKVAQNAFKLSDLLSDEKDNIHLKPFVEGKDLNRWFLGKHKFLEWDTVRAPQMFRRKTFVELYEHTEKIMLPMVGDIRAALDCQRLYCNHGIFVCLPWHLLEGIRNNSLKKTARYDDEKPVRSDLPGREKLELTSRAFPIKYLLGVLNSSMAQNFLRINRRNNVQLYPDDWKKLPVPIAMPEEQAPIIKLVDCILEAKKADHATDVSVLEAQVDTLVSALYNRSTEKDDSEGGNDHV
ncbi:MAG: Eco57I restriction-modification methylase domain-containing protein [Proteobacteria bacterium]|nr:Eco57I restriction-modification methylase domain-containing protein [Pseudomonadota bacterium]